MDKQIRKIEKENKKEGKDLKKLEHMDKKRDKLVEDFKEAGVEIGLYDAEKLMENFKITKKGIN